MTVTPGRAAGLESITANTAEADTTLIVDSDTSWLWIPGSRQGAPRNDSEKSPSKEKSAPKGAPLGL